MTSPEEMPVWSAGFAPESEGCGGVRPPSLGAPRAPGLGPDPGPPQKGGGESGLPGP
jgi:hypothetical protein